MTGKLCCRNERAEEQSLFRRCPSLLSLTLMSVLLSPLSLQAADMRNGFNGLASKVQNVLKDDPFSGHIFVFRGRSGKMVKILWADRDGLCLFAKRLERGRFVWPVTREGKVHLTPAQLSMLLEGIAWQHPKRTERPGIRI